MTTSREFISELLLAKANEIYDTHLQGEVRLDGWTAWELGQLYLELRKDWKCTSMTDLSRGVMDLIVLTVCAKVGCENKDQFHEEIKKVFPVTLLERKDFYSELMQSFSQCIRYPVDGKFLVWSAKNRRRPPRKPEGPPDLWSTYRESWPL